MTRVVWSRLSAVVSRCWLSHDRFDTLRSRWRKWRRAVCTSHRSSDARHRRPSAESDRCEHVQHKASLRRLRTSVGVPDSGAGHHRRFLDRHYRRQCGRGSDDARQRRTLYYLPHRLCYHTCHTGSNGLNNTARRSGYRFHYPRDRLSHHTNYKSLDRSDRRDLHSCDTLRGGLCRTSRRTLCRTLNE